MSDDLTALIGRAVLTLGVVAFVATLSAVPTWLLWNWLMPLLFKLPTITLLQGWGLNALASILTKSITVPTKR
jgi:hypothetical protein